MQVKFYCDFYVSECWREKKAKIIRKLKENRLQPQVYVVTLSQGTQNQLEFYSSILLKQKVFRHADLFIVGIVNGYDEALSLVSNLCEAAVREKGSADIRRFILERQAEYEKAGR